MTPPDELVVSLGSHPRNLDPRFAPDAFSDKIARLIFSPLLRRAADGGLEPHLAESVERPDPETWIVRLRRDARFHDGSPVLAGDVKATFDSIMDPELGSVKRLFLKPIESLEVPDDWTVVFRLREPTAPFAQVLAGIGIAPSVLLKAQGEHLGDQLIGSGPFRFEEQVIDSHVTLTANPDWFGGEVASPRLRFRIVPDGMVRVLELMHGSTDLTQNDLPPHTIERLRQEQGLAVQSSESALVKYMAFNTARGPLRDRRVRQAVASAIDRTPIVRYKLRGYATSARSFLHPQSWAYEPNSTRWPHDPERAKRLLDEAGFPDPGDGSPRLSLVYRTSEDTTAIAVAKILARQLRQVGIRMELRTNEWGVFFSDIVQGDFDLYTLTGIGIVDPDWYTFVLHSGSIPPNGANRPRYVRPEVDALLDQARVESDRGKRAELYRQVQRITSEDLPLLPLWYQHNVVVARAAVRGFVSTPQGDFASLATTTKGLVPR